MDRQDYINSVNLNRDTDFPYLVLDIIDANSYPRNPGFQVMHWHEDLQFIYVLSGTISVVTLDARVRVGPGEGVFINKNVVHLVEYRLCRAAELLRHTRLPVGEIAAAVGFGQPSHFGKCFREKTGLSPGAYRRGAAV